MTHRTDQPAVSDLESMTESVRQAGDPLLTGVEDTPRFFEPTHNRPVHVGGGFINTPLDPNTPPVPTIKPTPKPEPEDLVNHPKHYGSHPSGVECIRITEHMTFNPGNAVKYLWRAGDKGTQEKDLRKARWYIGRELLRLGFCTEEQFDAICELDQQEQSS